MIRIIDDSSVLGGNHTDIGYYVLLYDVGTADLLQGPHE
jgi:hypothetical protein